jgi:hypothetical protein
MFGLQPMPRRGSEKNNFHSSDPARLSFTFFLISMISLSAMTLISFHKQSDAQSSANCVNLSLSKAEASGSERRYPAINAIDNKLNTRWSNIGLPSWIEVDLGSS